MPVTELLVFGGEGEDGFGDFVRPGRRGPNRRPTLTNPEEGHPEKSKMAP